jgi:Na+-transporting NADH:ubiquinone oxidoreductase subunit NqrB
MQALIIASTDAHNFFNGPTLDFIPREVADAWRVVIFCLTFILLGDYLFTFPRAVRNREMPTWALFGFAGTVLFMIQQAAIQTHRWHDPVVLEGLPLATLAIPCVAWSRIERHRCLDRQQR